jgi:glycine cleavage system T protein (aminomethyltransferase)
MKAPAPFVRATPFHARAAEANRGNAWSARNGVTLATVYSDSGDEALAARLRVAMADISWRWRLSLEGDRVAELLPRLFTRDASKLTPGQSLKALWLTDGGAVRGTGLVARYGRDKFLLASSEPDFDWFQFAANAFDATARDISAEEGGLAIVGPYAKSVLERGGLDATLEPLQFRKLFWRGLDVTLSRWGENGGYEIWCKPDDGVLVWDRIARAGATFGILPAGLAAMDLLDLEAGIARPGRDYPAARDGFAKQPTPASLGLERLIDHDHTEFNGRPAWLANRETEPKTLVGIEIEADRPAPHTPLLLGERKIGHTLNSHYSPALRRAIALAQVERSAAEPGTSLTLTLSPNRETPDFRTVAARVVALPFLPAPDSIEP